MTSPELALDGASIVCIGGFKPANATPGSLAAEGLIANDVALAALSPIISPSVTIFDAAWLHCEATENRLLFATAEPAEFPSLRDLAISYLSSFASTTKVSAVGLNRNVHFVVASSDEWHTIGDKLIPKAAWQDVMKLPGTRSAVLVGVRPDDFLGQIQVTVEPSLRLPPDSKGVYIEQNDHYTLRRIEAQPTTREHLLSAQELQELTPEATADLIPLAREIIATKWDDSMARSQVIIDTVWNMRAE